MAEENVEALLSSLTHAMYRAQIDIYVEALDHLGDLLAKNNRELAQDAYSLGWRLSEYAKELK